MKVGKYDLPNIRLYPTLFDATKSLYENFKSEEATDELTVAKVLGHNTNKSGAFIIKLACLRAYGLIERRGVKVTELGKKLTYDPSEDERNKALKQVILNIPLWKEFHTKWGATPPTVNFWVELTKISGLEAPDAQKISETVRNAYLDDVRYLKPEKEQVEGTSKVSADQEIETRPIPRANEQADIVKGLIQQGAFDIAKDFIDFLKAKREEEKES